MLSATVPQNHQTHNCNLGFICSNSKLNKNVHKNRKMTFHIFPAATCNNNSTNKKPQRSIAIHRLLTFSFAACGNTTGPWRCRSKGGKPVDGKLGTSTRKCRDGRGYGLVLGYVSPYHWLGEANIQPLQSHPEIFDSKKIWSPLNQPATSCLVCKRQVLAFIMFSPEMMKTAQSMMANMSPEVPWAQPASRGRTFLEQNIWGRKNTERN